MASANKKKVQEYGGFILTFERGRRKKIDAALRLYRHEATETFSAVDWKFHPRELVLLSLGIDESSYVGAHTLNGAALMERMKTGGATGKLKMRLHSPVMFEEPIELKELPPALRRQDLFSTSLKLRRLQNETWRELFEQIKELRPRLASALSELERRQFDDRRIFPEDARTERLMEQRDAIGVAVDIAGLDRQRVLKSLDSARLDTASSALDLLDSEPLQEQDAIRMDQMAFGKLLTQGMRHARFSNQSGAEVRIHVYDRKPIETVLGIDLLIYMPLYAAYILVQYKMMRKASSIEGRWYYPVDPHLMKQLSAMNRASRVFHEPASLPIPIRDWRLSEEVFFWKFCESTRESDSEGSLIHGITLGRTHLDSFLGLQKRNQPRSGHRISYANCHRYLTTSQFVELAQAGWIGGGANARAFIEKLLKANQKGGRQTLIAVISQAERLESVRRGWN